MSTKKRIIAFLVLIALIVIAFTKEEYIEPAESGEIYLEESTTNEWFPQIAQANVDYTGIPYMTRE